MCLNLHLPFNLLFFFSHSVFCFCFPSHAYYLLFQSPEVAAPHILSRFYGCSHWERQDRVLTLSYPELKSVNVVYNLLESLFFLYTHTFTHMHTHTLFCNLNFSFNVMPKTCFQAIRSFYIVISVSGIQSCCVTLLQFIQPVLFFCLIFRLFVIFSFVKCFSKHM